MPEVVDLGWKFKASAIRSAVAKGNYLPFFEYVKGVLQETPSCQYICDGDEHLPKMTDAEFERLVNAISRGNLEFLAFAFNGADELTKLVFFGRTKADLYTRVEFELSNMVREGWATLDELAAVLRSLSTWDSKSFTMSAANSN